MENENKNYIHLNDILHIPNQNNENKSSYFQDLLKKVQSTSSAVKKMKLVEDHPYLLSQNKQYEQLLNKTSKKIENLIIKMMFFGKKIGNVNDIPNIRKNFDSVCDFVDDLLEKTADNMDIIKGIRKDKKDEDIENELKVMKKIAKTEIEKSIDQHSFMYKFCDNSYNFFIPKIKSKHNQLKQLSEEIIKEQKNREENYDKYKNVVWKDRAIAYNAKIIENPYNYEINHFFLDFNKRSDVVNNAFYNFQKDFKLNNSEDHFFQDFLNSNRTIHMEEVLSKDEFNEHNYFHKVFFNSEDTTNLTNNRESLKQIINPSHYLYKDLDSTNYLYIETYENWRIMLNDLGQNDEIAVDLEHHHLECYIGIVCLMQISTRFTDYIVDTIKLKEHIHEINEVFTNPRIIKVFHGSDFDINWLQRDFGVYVVNMFDTGQASKILEYQSYGLAYLLSKFCNITANKVHQKDDWRIRPLTKEMLKYAREDTHYLLYIYDCLKKQLLLKSFKNERPILNFFSIVMEKSKDICLKKYFKPEIKDYNYYGLISRNALILSKSQISIFKLIYKYRDYVARKENRSPEFILPNNRIFSIAKLTEWKVEDMFRLCDKFLFKNYLNDLISLIEEKLTKIGIVKEKKECHVQNYINDVKSKLNKNSSLIIKNNNINNELTTKINVFIKNVLNEKQQKHNFLEEVENLSSEISVRFQPKKIVKSRLVDEDDKMNIEKNSDNYHKLIEKFENFNLVNFLKEKHNLPNLRIAPIKQKSTTLIEKENIVQTNVPVKSETNLVSLNEKLLGKKRTNEIDLTSNDVKNLNQNEDEELESEEEAEEKKKDNYVGFEETKNFLASTKFIESNINNKIDILNKKDTEIKSFKTFKHNRNEQKANTKNNSSTNKDFKNKNINSKKKS